MDFKQGIRAFFFCGVVLCAAQVINGSYANDNDEDLPSYDQAVYGGRKPPTYRASHLSSKFVPLKELPKDEYAEVSVGEETGGYAVEDVD